MSDERDEKKDRVTDALQRDWEQTKHDLPGLHGEDLDQDVGDTVRQATGKEEPPPDGVPDRD